jgi:selenocysteine-specific elongation factor
MMLLVVDITKGIQTQTAECLVIGEITTDRMIVVLNKADMLPPDDPSDPRSGRGKQTERASARVRKALQNTRFANCPFIVVSAAPAAVASGAGAEGVSELVAAMRDTLVVPAREDKAALTLAAATAPGAGDESDKSKPSRKPFYFAIDHCFPIKGQGTVLTGTVLSGHIRVNDTIEIPSLRQERKIKSMQMFRKPVSLLAEGDRAGICVAGLDASLVERGIAATPGSVPSVPALLCLVKKVRFFKGPCTSESRFHITVGHSTVLATAIFFGAAEFASGRIPGYTRPNGSDKARDAPHIAYDWSRDYEWQPELLAGKAAPAAGALADAPAAAFEWQWAALLFDSPILCPTGAVLIGSKLDTEAAANACRIAFHGSAIEALPSGDVHELARLRLFKRKEKVGAVDRIEEGDATCTDAGPVTLIGKNLFKKETDMSLFVGLQVHTRAGQVGKIDSAFGKSGKFKVVFSHPTTVDPAAASAVPLGGESGAASKQSGKNGGKATGNVLTIRGGDPLYLRFRKYLFTGSGRGGNTATTKDKKQEHGRDKERKAGLTLVQ